MISLMNDGSKDQNLGQYCTVTLQQLLLTWTQGLSLREMLHEFKYQTLVLFKALLLQPKVYSIFFLSKNCMLTQDKL